MTYGLIDYATILEPMLVRAGICRTTYSLLVYLNFSSTGNDNNSATVKYQGEAHVPVNSFSF